MIHAIIYLLLTVLPDDVQDANTSRSFLHNWWYAQNRAAFKYMYVRMYEFRGGGPRIRYTRREILDGNEAGDWYTVEFQKDGFTWWKPYFTWCIDLWHLAKTVRIWVTCHAYAFYVADLSGVKGFAFAFGLWVLYGVLHDYVLYNRLFNHNKNA